MLSKCVSLHSWVCFGIKGLAAEFMQLEQSWNLSHLHFCFLSASSATKQVSAAESQEKGQKRKSLEEEEEKNGREELVEKKVCKGFQTVWKQMYSICTFDVGLSESRTKLSFGSLVCLPVHPLAGSKLGSVGAPWASWLCLLHLGLLAVPAEAAAPQHWQD